MITRRNILKGAVAVPAAVVLPIAAPEPILLQGFAWHAPGVLAVKDEASWPQPGQIRPTADYESWEMWIGTEWFEMPDLTPKPRKMSLALLGQMGY